MMLGRGVKYQFSAGECVLCFEPDSSKARVLYEAKVLETSIGKDESGKRIPEYLIHFQGWNNSWDRVVGEYLVLKHSVENQLLMKKITSVVRKVRGNKNRIKKINSILKHTLPADNKIMTAVAGGDEEDDESSEEEETDDDTDTDIELNTMRTNSTSDEGDAGASHETHSSSSSDDSPTFTLNIPSALKKVLDEDFVKIQKQKQIIHLPQQNNVITILESYAKDYAINTIVSTGDRGRLHRENNQQTQRNITLCNEVMDGLRILFDFLLPTNLLYNPERPQYENIINEFKPKLIKREISGVSECEADLTGTLLSPPSTSSPRQSRSRTAAAAKNYTPATVTTETKTTPKHRGQKRDYDLTGLRESSESSETPVKRVTRQSEKNRSPGEESIAIPVAPSSGYKRTKPVAVAERVSRRVNKPVTITTATTIVSDSSTTTTVITDKPVEHSAAAGGSSSLKTGINDILDWKLIPDEVYSYTPAPPTLIYGTQHLLRLFVKLPDVISMMNIPHNKRKVLLSHFEQLLDYISEHREELLHKSAYISQ
ncbi:MSL complex subunit 3-like isoform X1 [Tubulanus polymorphus]|uniref:MSL complex subunit 3-like isoform X1 n=1 Tax=Tubulanus polymorphus TaxID=672921 RepID=UPI003DA4D21A